MRVLSRGKRDRQIAIIIRRSDVTEILVRNERVIVIVLDRRDVDRVSAVSEGAIAGAAGDRVLSPEDRREVVVDFESVEYVGVHLVVTMMPRLVVVNLKSTRLDFRCYEGHVVTMPPKKPPLAIGRPIAANPLNKRVLTRVTAQDVEDIEAECERLSAITGQRWTPSAYLRVAGRAMRGKHLPETNEPDDNDLDPDCIVCRKASRKLRGVM